MGYREGEQFVIGVRFTRGDPAALHVAARDLIESGVDVIFDHIGADTWQANIRSLKPGGRLVMCGVTSGYEVATDLRYIFFRRLSVLGSTMGTKGELLQIMNLVERGMLRPVIDSTYPLKEIAAAHERMESRKGFGKIVVNP